MARNFNELRAKMPPESQARAHAKAEEYRAEMALPEIRQTRDLTQEEVASSLGIKQAAVSKLERSRDLRVSTLRTIIQALGGALEIDAVFPDGSRVRLNQFNALPRILRQRRMR